MVGTWWAREQARTVDVGLRCPRFALASATQYQPVLELPGQPPRAKSPTRPSSRARGAMLAWKLPITLLLHEPPGALGFKGHGRNLPDRQGSLVITGRHIYIPIGWALRGLT